MDMKQKLAEYKEEVTRWEKVTYRELKSDEAKKKSVRKKRSVLFIDPSMARKMLDALGLSANRIALLIMDQCNFGSNIFYGTYEEIGQELNISKGSVIKGMTELQTADFIRKQKNGRWMLNPQVGTKCYAEDVNDLMDMYSRLEPYLPKKEKEGSENDLFGSSFQNDESF